MPGPCLCGDPYCPSCGSPLAAELEAAEEGAMQLFQDAKLSPHEYELAVRIGLAAIKVKRQQPSLLSAAIDVCHAYEASPDGELGKGFNNGHFFKLREAVTRELEGCE